MRKNKIDFGLSFLELTFDLHVDFLPFLFRDEIYTKLMSWNTSCWLFSEMKRDFFSFFEISVQLWRVIIVHRVDFGPT